MIKGCKKAICADPEEPDLPASECNPSSDVNRKKEEKTALNKKRTAMAAYMLAFTEVAQMNIIYKEKEVKSPKGTTNRVTKQLMK